MERIVSSATSHGRSLMSAVTNPVTLSPGTIDLPENAAKASSTSLIGASVQVTEIRRACSCAWRGAGASTVGSNGARPAEDHGSKSPDGLSRAIRRPRASGRME